MMHSAGEPLGLRRSRQGILLGLLLAGVALGCDRPGAATASAAHAGSKGVRAKVVQTSRRDFVRRVTLPATVRADLEVTLHSKVTGYVKAILKDRGDRVKAGDLIASLEVPEMILDVDSVKASFALEDTTLRRLEAIRKVERTAVTDQDLDLARAKRAMAEASLKRIQTMLTYTEIRAPFDGTVTERFVDPGAFVQQGRIVSLVDASKVRVLLDVPEPEVRFAEIGAAARIHLDALPGMALQARVARRSSALDPASRTMRIEIEIPNPELKILPGMFARVDLDVERHPNAFAIPSKAVLVQQEKSFVFLYAGGTAHKVPVEIGEEEGDWAEAVKGLKGGEAILVPEGQLLVDGGLVQVAEGS